jgi:hypothetical protein
MSTGQSSVEPPRKKKKVNTESSESIHTTTKPVKKPQSSVKQVQAGATDIADPNAPAPTQSVSAILKDIAGTTATPGQVAPFARVAESPHVIYDYRTFVPSNLIFSSKPFEADGGGEMYFINYKYPDGKTAPLMINTPCLRTAKGVQKFKDSKTEKQTTVIYMSMDDGWETNDEMVSYRAMCDAIDERCCELICEKKWCGTRELKPEEIKRYLMPVLAQGAVAEDGTQYKPSMKVLVIGDQRSRTTFFVEPTLSRVVADMIQPSSWLTAVISDRWVYRKKQGDRNAYPLGFSFSQNIAGCQVVIHSDSHQDEDVCRVRLPPQLAAAVAEASAQPIPAAVVPPDNSVEPNTTDMGDKKDPADLSDDGENVYEEGRENETRV